LATIATLLCAFAFGGGALALQEVPDPRLDLPRASTWIPGDSYEARTEIGPLHNPAGKVRRVTWYVPNRPEFQENGRPKPWSKRVVQDFDEAGHCVGIERLSGYLREYREFARSPSGSMWEHEEWAGDYPDRWLEETLTDPTGRPVARLLITLDIHGLPHSGYRPFLVSEWQYDESGRCCRELRYGGPCGTEVAREWSYDDQGRIERVTDGWSYLPTATKFDYDVGGRLTARTERKRGDPTTYRTEFDHDEEGRLVRSVDRVNGYLTGRVALAYGPDGKLIFRQKLDARFGAPSSRSEETFDGIDRPIHREVFDARGRVTSRMSWTYDDDLRGNWIRKRCRADIGACGVDVGREIEYAD
jgi:hypothetical protein